MSAVKKGCGPNEDDTLSIPNWDEFMGSPAAAVPVSPPGNFLHSWDSHSIAAQAHCASSQPCHHAEAGAGCGWGVITPSTPI